MSVYSFEEAVTKRRSWIATPDSSAIVGFGYKKEKRVLTVEFKEGRRRYDYFDVPEALFERMKAAASKGQFFAENIRDAYRYARV
jgi:hypothetical protein